MTPAVGGERLVGSFGVAQFAPLVWAAQDFGKVAKVVRQTDSSFWAAKKHRRLDSKILLDRT